MTNKELSSFIDEYGKTIYCFCIKLTGNRQEGEELYQDTLLKGTELKSRIDDRDNTKAYFMGIAVRIWKNRRRKEERHLRILPRGEWDETTENTYEDKNSNIERMVIQNEMKQLLCQLVSRLPEELRIVTYMYYTAEMTTLQIAGALHIPEGTVKSQLNRMRKVIRKGMEEQGYEQYRA